MHATFVQIHGKVLFRVCLHSQPETVHVKVSDLFADHQGQKVGTEKEDFAEECQRLC